ncbi:MAG: class I SAM-dependent methyltransferase [Myxococcales bacterium]
MPLVGVLAAAVAIAVSLAAHMHGRHGNPEDLDSYIGKMEDPSRAEWQKPADVLRALALRPGQIVCDVGAGPGYFTFPIARAVGEAGHVYAADVEPRILEALRKRLRKNELRNVTPVLALENDPLVPPASCDVILVVDTFHHFPDGPAYLRRLARSLRPGGRLVNIDFHKRELPVGPPPEHKLTRDEFLAQAAAAGLALAQEHTFLPYQYFLSLAPRA